MHKTLNLEELIAAKQLEKEKTKQVAIWKSKTCTT